MISPIFRSRKWLIGHLLVVFVAVGFVNLGFWQLRRLDDRLLENAAMRQRMASPSMPIEDLVIGAGADVESLAFRSATATGEFQPDHEVLVRSQVYNEVAGFHVITPLLLDDGSALLVNRGWVPLEMDEVPVPAAPPPGRVSVEGQIRATQVRSSSGPVDDPTTILAIVARVDLDRLGSQMPWPLAPVFLVATDLNRGHLPIPAPLPEFTDEGSHLLYAIQWFSFTIIGVVGYAFLLRRASHEVQQGELVIGPPARE